MRRKPYSEREDGMRVWLASKELNELLNIVTQRGTVKRALSESELVAVELTGRASPWLGELVEVVVSDVADGLSGNWTRVDETTAEKGGYCEPPISATLAARIDAVGDRRDVNKPAVD